VAPPSSYSLKMSNLICYLGATGSSSFFARVVALLIPPGAASGLPFARSELREFLKSASPPALESEFVFGKAGGRGLDGEG
jgi:hypothetical protein